MSPTLCPRGCGVVVRRLPRRSVDPQRISGILHGRFVGTLASEVHVVDVQLRVLGPLEVVRDHDVVPLTSPQQRRLLTALVLSPGTVVSNDRLMAALWPATLPRSARKSLHAHVSRLRDALGDDGDTIATHASGYALRVAPDHIDAGRFEHLAARARMVTSTEPTQALRLLDDALGLWRGPALADFADEAFVRADAVRLEELRLTVIEERVDLLLADGRHADVIAELEAFTRRHPLRERPQAQLMLALHRDGRQADALAVFRAWRSTLAEEYGLEPSASLQALERDILRRDPRLDDCAQSDEDEHRPSAVVELPLSVGLAGAVESDVADRAPMLERDTHLVALDNLLIEVLGSRHGRLAVVRGEAGIGKTTLTRTFCDRHRAAVRLLWGACDPLFTPRPLGPIRDVAETVGGPLLTSVRIGAQPYDVAADLFKDLRTTAPTVLVLEDLHWADEATLDVLRLLGRRVAALPALVLVTYRDDEIDVVHPLRRVVGELGTLSATCELRLEALSKSAVTELAAPRGRDGEQIHALTGGNPLFVLEALDAHGDEVPASISQAVLGRASRLDPRARAALDAIAIATPMVEIQMLTAIAGTTVDVIDTCVSSGIVVAEASGIAFRHELARRAVAEAIPAHRATGLHRRVLHALRSLPADRRDLSRLAHHADAAGDIDEILRFGRAAAEQAAAMGAHREAAVHYAHVLRHADRLAPAIRATVLEQYAQACYRTDQNTEAISAIQQAVALYRQLGDQSREGVALLALSHFLWCPGRTKEAMTNARHAMKLLEPVPHGPELGMACSTVGQLALNAEDIDGAVTWSRRAVDIAQALGEARIDVHARTNLATVAGLTGDDVAWEQFDQCLATAEASGLDEDVTRVLLNLATCAIRRHNYSIASDTLRRAEAWCRDLGHELGLSYVRAYGSVAAIDLDDWRRAAQLADLVVAYPRSSTIPRILALTVTALIAARTARGDPWPALDLARDLAAATGELERLVPPALARAELAWLAGRPAAIVDATDEPWRLAVERRATWMIGPLASWRRRAGIDVELPEGIAEPYVLQAAGRHLEAAQWWSSRGCGYIAALSLLDAADQASVIRASQTFRDLGAQALAEHTAGRRT